MNKVNEEGLLPQELSTEELEDVNGGYVDMYGGLWYGSHKCPVRERASLTFQKFCKEACSRWCLDSITVDHSNEVIMEFINWRDNIYNWKDGI